MQLLTVVSVIHLLQLIDFCVSNKHSHGKRNEYFSYRLLRRTLIEDYNDVPTNYTIIFQYFEAHYNPVQSIDIDVNVRSSGYIHGKAEMKRHSHGQDYRTSRQVFDGRISIKNALNVTAVLNIYGVGYPISVVMRDQGARSCTVIYAKKARPSENSKQFAQNSIGKRREGDTLIYFQSRNVTNVSRFPSRSFEYSGNKYITYVGFSFNSPTAIAMVNTSFMAEKEFNAIVYDMNTEHFVANMSIYGRTSKGGFEGIV